MYLFYTGNSSTQSADLHQGSSSRKHYHYYAALLPRRGPHIASHSVCLSVCPSVPLSSVTWRHLANYNDTLRAAYRTAISAAQTCLLCWTQTSYNSSYPAMVRMSLRSTRTRIVLRISTRREWFDASKTAGPRKHIISICWKLIELSATLSAKLMSSFSQW